MGWHNSIGQTREFKRRLSGGMIVAAGSVVCWPLSLQPPGGSRGNSCRCGWVPWIYAATSPPASSDGYSLSSD